MILANGFNRANALYAAFATIVHESDAAIAAKVTGGTATASATIALAGHAFTVGQRVIRSAGSGWTNIPADVPLFVVAAVASTSIGVSLAEGGVAISDTGTDAAFHACEVFYAEPLNNDSAPPEFAYIKRRGMGGLEGNAAQMLKSTTGEWSWPLDEALRVLDLFGGADVGQSLGYNKIYVRDAADIASKVRKVSERFYGSITTSSNANDGGGEFSKPSLKLTATKPDGSQVVFTKNVTVAV